MSREDEIEDDVEVRSLFSRTTLSLMTISLIFSTKISHSLSEIFSFPRSSLTSVFTFSLINQTHTGRASFARLHHRRRALRRTVIVRALFVPKLLPVRFFRPPVRLGRVRVLLFVVAFPGIRRRSRREKRQSRRRIRR